MSAMQQLVNIASAVAPKSQQSSSSGATTATIKSDSMPQPPHLQTPTSSVPMMPMFPIDMMNGSLFSTTNNNMQQAMWKFPTMMMPTMPHQTVPLVPNMMHAKFDDAAQYGKRKGDEVWC